MLEDSPASAQSAARLAAALTSHDSSARLQAAMTAGTRADASTAHVLVDRCAVEPDFGVREMLTWAITRLPVDAVLPLVLEALASSGTQGQTQALHTVSKLGDPRAWPAITDAHLHHADADLARTAWRAAVSLVPGEEREALATDLLRELGRGDFDTMRSLSRALVALGDTVTAPLAAAARGDDGRAAHARATQRLAADPEAAFVLDPADFTPDAPTSSAASGTAPARQ